MQHFIQFVECCKCCRFAVIIAVCCGVFHILEKHMHILDNLKELKDMVAGIGQPEAETPGGLDCFDSAQARTIVQYFHTS